MMGWEIHPAKAAFPHFAEDWDRLNGQLYASHPLYDSRFVGPMLEYFASGKERLCIHRTDGLVTGALILKTDGMGRWSSFKPSQSQATALLLDNARVLETLFVALPGFAWSLELYAIDPRYSPDLSPVDLVHVISPQAQTIGIHPHTSFSDYWNERPKNLKANVRRYFSRVKAEFGSPVLSKSIQPTEMRGGVARFGELEMAGWKGEAGTAISVDNSQGKFYSEIMGRFARSNQAAVIELYFNDHLAASRLVISNEKMVIFLKTSYDEMLARFAAGRLLLHRVIEEQVNSQNGKTIEFYTNATRDQNEWGTFGCTIQNIQVFRNESIAATFSIAKGLRDNLRNPTAVKQREGTIVSKAVEVITYSDIEAFSNEKYGLDESSTGVDLEASIGWFDLLQKHVYSDNSGVNFYVVAESKRPSIVLPLRLTTQGRVRTVESLGNFYTSLYTPLLSKDSDLLAIRHLLAAASRNHGGAHTMRFSPMDPQSPVYAGLMNELRAIGWIPFKYFCFGNWFLKVNENWQGYLRKRSANLRSVLKRRSKAFTAAGGSLEVVAGTERIEHAIDAFQEIYSASWKIPEPYPDFVPSLIRHLAATGMLRLGIARLQDKPVAAQLWIVGQDKASIYKVAYHGAFASYSPGTVLTGHLMQYVIEQDHVKEVDFLIGDDKYKQIWMSNRRERWGIVAYNPRTIIGLALFAKEVLWRMTKSIFKNVHSK